MLRSTLALHLLVSLLLAVSTTALGQSNSRGAGLPVGELAPPWTGTDLATGDTIEFPEVLENSPAVLVFWATWCPYCKAFMPYTLDIASDYAASGVKIITFNAKERGHGDPKAYIESLDGPLLAVANADAIAQDYGVNFIPGLMVVDGDGEVIYRRGWTDKPAGRSVAQQWDSEVRKALDGALTGP